MNNKMTLRNELITKINYLNTNYGLKDHAIGLGATNDPKIVGRLRKGRNIMLDNIDDLINFINGHLPENEKITYRLQNCKSKLTTS